MGGITARGIPYVTATDHPKEFPVHSQALANVIEAQAFVARGTVPIPVVNNGASTSAIAITFPAGLFTGPPCVTVTAANSRLIPAVQGTTASGATLVFSNWSGAATPGTTTGYWIAAGT